MTPWAAPRTLGTHMLVLAGPQEFHVPDLRLSGPMDDVWARVHGDVGDWPALPPRLGSARAPLLQPVRERLTSCNPQNDLLVRKLVASQFWAKYKEHVF